MSRRIRFAPAEGWATVGLVLLVCLTMAWTIDDARWVLGRAEYLDHLVLAAAGGVLAGFVGAKVGWGRWLTYLIGCIFAALVVPLLTGLRAFPGGASPHDLFTATATAVVTAYQDIAIRNMAATPQYLHYIFSLGILVWATSMFASYAVFGHRRALNGVLVVGVILVGNMALTLNDELPFLVLYTLASLFLLIRTHVFDEQSEWLRRRIGDPASISSVYLRGGSVFVAATVGAAVLLTQAAASAPLAGAWDGVEDGLISLSRSISRYLPTGGTTRSIGLAFGADTQVGQLWNTDQGVAVTITRNATDKRDYYWRAVTYDRIDARGWGRSESTTSIRPAGSTLLEGLADGELPAGLTKVTFTVSPVGFRLPTLLAPLTPVEVDLDVRLTHVGAAGYYAAMERDGGAALRPYTVSALVPVVGDDPGQLNSAALRAAGTDYPQDIFDLYTSVSPGSMGPNTLKLEAKILSEANSLAPIDLADQLVEELHSSAYTYATDVRELDCANLSVSECFATHRRGFCQYYAATMAVILRHQGVPTRIAEGFLPGARSASGGSEQILFSNAHSWVEVYFPGYGWVPFDPTGGGVSQLAPLPSGRPVASGLPAASFSAVPQASRGSRDEGVPGPTGSIDPTGRGSLGPLIVIGLLLLLMVVAGASIAWQRGPRGPATADGAYGMVTRLASRFGFGPRPTQTVYEFSGSLSEILPGSRPELEVVARAKVESTYSRAVLGEERVAALMAAQRRLRVSLLRLAFRRRGRPRRRG
jgi:transglutaminase-like putative cysteine protease